ncbi:MAG TPA: LTA synthase family protein [Desulfitobacteriaceae bacterium]|nr:LTA synthase family protein [Desulfitobacteriaceae bacterium]
MFETKSGAKPAHMLLLVLLSILIKSVMVLYSLFSARLEILSYSIYAVAPVIFLISFSYLFPRKGQIVYLLGLDLIISGLFIADVVYARAYAHLPSIYMLFAQDNMEDLGASVFSLLRGTDFLLLLDLPFLFFLALKARYQDPVRKRIRVFSLTVVCSAVIIGFQFGQLADSKMFANYKLQPLLMSPLGNHMFDICRFIYEQGDKLDQEEAEQVTKWLGDNQKYQEPEAAYAGLAGLLKNKNIIVVQVESLENILVGKSYYGQEITPHINSLLANSIYFKHIVEQVRDGNSSDAELLFNASLYPVSSGSTFLRFGDNTYLTLPKLLREKGYTSLAIHGDNRKYWNRDRVFRAFGFDEFIAEDQFADKSSVGMGIADEALFSQALAEIKKLREPYNIFIITLTSHMPFTLDENKQYLDLPVTDETSAYLQSIAYTDEAFGKFYEQLAAEGLLDNTALILYGDHEGVHKYYPTPLPANNSEIPFLIHIPGMQGFTVDKNGGQIDMLPTIAFLMGIEANKYSATVMGRNLFGKYPGSALLPTGEVLGANDDAEHLAAALGIADMSIRGDYFKQK